MITDKVAQKRIAKISISTSAYRNNGKPGLINLTREFVEEINLNEFAKSLKQNSYSQFLDKQTFRLQKYVLSKTYGKGWGISRKGLNIYFREICYNYYFRKKLNIKESYLTQLEIPLDNKVIKAVKKYKVKLGLKKLPNWKSIKNLESSDSKEFQSIVKRIAKIEGVIPVHLDIKWWSE